MSQPSHRLTEWVAFLNLEPFGPWRDNWHFAQLAAISYNPHVNRDHMKSPMDFMWKPQREVETDKASAFINALSTLVRDNGN